MKYVLLYEAPIDLGKARSLFTEHRATWQKFRDSGELLMIGPFSDPSAGAMGVFTTRAAAEEFVRLDPFVTQGAVRKWTVHEWNEVLSA